MAQKDYYELLGVSKGATEQELKAAYKKKVMEKREIRHPLPERLHAHCPANR